ncbi:MsnO8 family LLM class oxidoreductase [Cutibacterium acnes]|uniref:MsnO8 family LLM class oxidoreductase n=1 Tax=Cutibacterium acnes TaxID=1747 RepID=UPI0001EF297E|nr:MsnO8 family LLM class oxidoreductase [Cutibacterium acnes]EFS62842.1 luciferase family oxidoreductase, FMN-dependent, PP_0088 family [Cutibacterium acnes HL063PA1]
MEQIPLFVGHDVTQTLDETVTLAQKLEEIGFHRFWLAEHHNTDHFLSSAPDLLMARIATATQSIRLGSGGVMAMHYGSLQMAERFSTLTAFFGDRIDMGLGRAPGGDMLSAHALNQGQVIRPEAINSLIAETVGFVRETLPPKHPYAKVVVTPAGQIQPQTWLLGSSGQSAAWAGEQGMDYAYAQFFTGRQDTGIMDHYRAHLSDGFPGRTLSAVCVSAGPTRQEALEQSLMAANFRVSLGTGRPVTFVTASQMDAETRSLLTSYVLSNEDTIFVGDYDEVADKLTAFQDAHHVDELMLISYIDNVQTKVERYRQLAKRLI